MGQVIRAKLDTKATAVSEISGPTLEPQPTGMVPTTRPIFGLALTLYNALNKQRVY